MFLVYYLPNPKLFYTLSLSTFLG